jgi:hypothetical protein
MGQLGAGDGKRRLQAIEAQLRSDHPGLESRLRGGGALFVTVRMCRAVGVLALGVAMMWQMHRWGIGTAYFAVILLVVGTTEVVRRTRQLAVLLRNRRR